MRTGIDIINGEEVIILVNKKLSNLIKKFDELKRGEIIKEIKSLKRLLEENFIC